MAFNPPFKSGPVSSKPVGPGGATGIGTNFGHLISGKPNAPIKKAVVGMPNRGDFGGPVTAPTIEGPNRASYGRPDIAGIHEAGRAVSVAQAGFQNPTGTSAFHNLMSLANERTGAQESEIGRHAADASQRRGYSGGFEDSAASAQADRMSALASTGFQGAAQIRQEEGDMYGKAIGAFTQLQDSYQQAKTAGDVSYASDLTKTHIAQAEAGLHALDLNSQQGLAYADAVNQAKRQQAQLDSDFNKDLIDNNRYIDAQHQLAAQLMMQREALQAQATAQDKTLAARKREFDTESAFKEKQFGEQKREFDTGLKANPNTALRAVPGKSFSGFLG